MSAIPFVSYSQNGEDVLLWRALKDVEHGFYIDVGAQDPVNFSITKAFYERGWRGINIEPVQRWYELLVRDRPHDVNLRVAAGSRPGTITLFEVEDTGLSTADAEFAHRHAASGFKVHEQIVECKTLNRICTENSASIVHFLKIDCEGSEKPVLEGFSLTDVRPWIILVEATEPLSTKETWQQWEHLLTSRQYRFVLFDGLNRFYVAEEHADLAEAFGVPVNVFDDVQRISDINAQARIDRLSREVESLKGASAIANVQAKMDAISDDRERLKRELDVVGARCQHLLDRLDAAHVERQQLADRLGEIGVQRELLQRRIDAYRVELAQLLLHVNVLMVERDNLRVRGRGLESEAEALRAKANQLEREQAALFGSHSWRITAPLRSCSRAASRSRRALRRAACSALRPLAHTARPMLRRVARNDRVRGLVVATFGKHAGMVEHSRLFLFGAASSGSSAADDQPQVPDDARGENAQPPGSDQLVADASLAKIDELINATVQQTRSIYEQRELGPQGFGDGVGHSAGSTVEPNGGHGGPAIDPIAFKRAATIALGVEVIGGSSVPADPGSSPGRGDTQ